MRIAALYDIHGNLPALDAVLADVEREGVDLLVIGGDVYPGPMASEALSRIQSCAIPHRAISGNGERVVLETIDRTRSQALPPAAIAGIDWCAQTIGAEQQREIRGWPATLRLEVPKIGSVLFVHATPRNDTEIFTEATPDDVVRAVFAGVEADVVLCGHTHMQFDRRVDALRIVNAGSVGMPFDAPAAYWVSIDDDVTLRQTRYDRVAAAAVLARSAYPAVDRFVEQHVLTTPARAAMLETYRGLEVRA